MKKRIIFVDDEPSILEGLRNRLRRQRRVWEMSFVGSGREALQALSDEPFDVIVSDMRMPEMDGATLLASVQAKYPSVARIVLSGHSELESALRAVPVAHQFLTKPCDAGVLENVVERACRLQTLISDETVRNIVGKIEKLPPVPRVYTQLTAALTNEDTTVDEVCEILKQDMAICAKVLQVVNSAFFRLARTVTAIEEAVTYLGFNSIKQVALAAEVFQHNTAQRTPIPLETLQNHAMLVASLASSFFTAKQQKDDAFVVGLLHDIGKLVLVVELPDHMDKVLSEMKCQNCSMYSAEMFVSGVTHAEVGGYLLGLWGLPYPIMEAVANHHEPTRVDANEFGVLAAAHIADALIHEQTSSGTAGTEQCHTTLDQAYVDSLGLTENLPAWRERAQELMTESTDQNRQ